MPGCRWSSLPVCASVVKLLSALTWYFVVLCNFAGSLVGVNILQILSSIITYILPYFFRTDQPAWNGWQTCSIQHNAANSLVGSWPSWPFLTLEWPFMVERPLVTASIWRTWIGEVHRVTMLSGVSKLSYNLRLTSWYPTPWAFNIKWLYAGRLCYDARWRLQWPLAAQPSSMTLLTGEDHLRVTLHLDMSWSTPNNTNIR